METQNFVFYSNVHCLKLSMQSVMYKTIFVIFVINIIIHMCLQHSNT